MGSTKTTYRKLASVQMVQLIANYFGGHNLYWVFKQVCLLKLEIMQA